MWIRNARNLFLLFRFRRVSKRWYREIGGTVDWVAAEFIRLNTPGYLRSVGRTSSGAKDSLRRNREDLASFEALLAEDVGEALGVES